MKAAAVSKLKAALSEYLARVKQGEEVLVTERGKPIARIVPIRGGMPDDARRRELARRGVLRLGKGAVSADVLRDLPVATVPLDVLDRVIDEEREDRL